VAVFVLVHPAWFGGWCWRDVVPKLRAAGHEVSTPTLTGLGEREHLLNRDVTLNTHVDDVVKSILFDDLHDITLVGNSSGGTVITAVADRIPDRVATIVYLDAFVPGDGESTLGLIATDRSEALIAVAAAEGDGWLVPRWAPMPWDTIVRDIWRVTDDVKADWVLSRLRPTPLAHLTDPVRLENADGLKARRVYIRCPAGMPAPFDRWAAEAKSSPDWTYRELPGSHIPFATQPKELAELLLEVRD